MIARAEQWFQAGPLYNQDACFHADAGYTRTDCSGFVSMVWRLPVSYATPREGLEHDLTDVAYDFDATPVKHQTYTWQAPGEYDYVPIRYTPEH